MQEDAGRCEEDARRSFEIQGGAGRNKETGGLRWREIKGGTGRFEGDRCDAVACIVSNVPGDAGRCRAMHGDAGRSREVD